MKLVSLLVKIAVLIFFVTLALINTHKVPFFYVPGQQFAGQLILILFAAFVVGAVFGIFAMFGRLLRLRAENSRLRSELQKAARLAEEDIAAPTQTAPAAKPETQPENPAADTPFSDSRQQA